MKFKRGNAGCLNQNIQGSEFSVFFGKFCIFLFAENCFVYCYFPIGNFMIPQEEDFTWLLGLACRVNIMFSATITSRKYTLDDTQNFSDAGSSSLNQEDLSPFLQTV